MTPYIFHFISEASASHGGDRRKVISLLCIFSVRFRASPLMTTKINQKIYF